MQASKWLTHSQPALRCIWLALSHRASMMHAMQSFGVSRAHLQPAGLVESPAILSMRPVLSLRLLRLGSLGSTDGRAAQQVLEGRQGVGRSAALLPA